MSLETEAVRPEEWHRTLVELAPDVLYSIAPDGTFTALSPAFEWVTGWAVDDWLGQPFAGLIHPEDLALAAEQFQKTLAGSQTGPYELRIRSHSGDYLIGEIRSMPRMENGRVTGTIGVGRDITERKRIEQELRTLQQVYRNARDQLDTILQAVDDGITVQDRSGRLVYVNATAARLAGFSSAEEMLASQSSIWDRFHLLDDAGRSIPVEELPGRRVLRGEPAGEREVSYRLPDGEERWSLVRARPIYDTEGRVESVVNVFQDITERRRTQTVQQQLAAIVESSSDAIIGKTLDAIITSWNRAAELLYGYRAEEVIGQSVSILVSPDRPDELPGIMARLRRGERIESLETMRVRKDGTAIAVSLSISPVYDPSGRIVGAATIARDITAQKQAEAERAEILERERAAREPAEAGRSRLAFLARASEILAGSLDYDTTLANVARLAVPQLADVCVIDLLDENRKRRRVALTHVDPERLEWIKDFEQRYATDPLSPESVLITGRAQVIPEVTDEMLVRSAQSEEHLADLRSFRLSSIMAVALKSRDRIIGQIGFLATESGRHYGSEDLALAEDLARRAATAVDNARLYHEAQRALHLRDEFLSIASHELKTPLTALQLHVQVLERALTSSQDGALDRQRVERFVDGARRQMQRLAKLINDLLDVSRISSGKYEPQPEEVDLGAIVQEVVDRFAAEAAVAGSRLTLHRNGPVRAWADGVQFDQVVTNLLSNAIKYGLGRPIDIRLEADGAVARLAVEDRGMGIAPEHLPLVFDRFERVTLSHNYGGLGLGLYITRQIVEAHGGRINVESTLDHGTTFTVELPLEWKS